MIGKTSIEKYDFRVKIIIFWKFTISFYNISWLYYLIPWQIACGKPFYTATSASEICLITLCFLLQHSNYMVWHDICQCNYKLELFYFFSNSEIILNSIIGRNLDKFSQWHAPCLSFIPQYLGSKPSPWSNIFALAIFI